MREITAKLLVLIIAISIFAGGLVSAGNLAYAYLKIISPTKGQKIPAGSIVNITGTSTPANATSHCVVSVIINGIQPYQKVIPTGIGSINGTKDYRLWKFTDNPVYATIKPGLNKITAKYSCSPKPDLGNNKQPTFVRHHSINVTGI